MVEILFPFEIMNSTVIKNYKKAYSLAKMHLQCIYNTKCSNLETGECLSKPFPDSFTSRVLETSGPPFLSLLQTVA